MKAYTYNWYHVPSGESGKSYQEFPTRMEFLENLNRWNGLGKHEWIYWE